MKPRTRYGYFWLLPGAHKLAGVTIHLEVNPELTDYIVSLVILYVYSHANPGT